MHQLEKDRDEEIECISETTEKVLKYLIKSVKKFLKELAVITRQIMYNAANAPAHKHAHIYTKQVLPILKAMHLFINLCKNII